MATTKKKPNFKACGLTSSYMSWYTKRDKTFLQSYLFLLDLAMLAILFWVTILKSTLAFYILFFMI